MRDQNAESIDSMLRSDRANIAIEEKFKSAKKHFGHFRKNENSEDVPAFFRLPMVKTHLYRVLSKSLNKKTDLINDKTTNSNYASEVYERSLGQSNSIESIKEIETKEFFDEAEEEKNAIESGIRIRQKKLIKHLENNSHEIKEELLKKVTRKIPKFSFKMKNLTVQPEDISGKNFFFLNKENNENSFNYNTLNKNKNNFLNCSIKTNEHFKNFNSSSVTSLNKDISEKNNFNCSAKFDNNDFLDFSPEKPRRGHFRNSSNVDSFYPKFRDSFIGGNYLRNLNDFHIAESGTPKKDRILNVSFIPRRTNQSTMEEVSKNLEKIYADKVSIPAPSWPLFHEKFYTLHKLNDFGRKKTDFKNTLYKSDIHVDKPLVSQSPSKKSNSKAELRLKKESIKDKGDNYIRKISIKRGEENNCEKEKADATLKNNNSNNNNNNSAFNTKRHYFTNNITLNEKNSSNNTERNSLFTMKNRPRKELRLTNLNSVQLANVNMSNKLSNNPIPRIIENTIMRLDKKSDTDVINKAKDFEEIINRKFQFERTNENNFRRNVSFNNFGPMNNEKISNIEKAKKIMYDNKMSKLIDYFQQGGI